MALPKLQKDSKIAQTIKPMSENNLRQIKEFMSENINCLYCRKKTFVGFDNSEFRKIDYIEFLEKELPWIGSIYTVFSKFENDKYEGITIHNGIHNGATTMELVYNIEEKKILQRKDKINICLS